MEPENQSEIPTQPAVPHVLGGGGGAVEPRSDAPVAESDVGGLLGAGRSTARSGAWQPPSPEALQRDFPQYEIRGILGRGGMGAVYKGWQKSLDRWVAIKILPPGCDDDVSDFTERFKREARAMAHLNHPGIVSVYDAGETAGGLLYFIMECIEGTDLEKLVKERGRIAQDEALRIIAHVCQALGYAHAHGVIHRDIKPSNIMIEKDGDVKVADFGLAKSTAPETTVLTMSNVLMGTPDFIAPEAMAGAAHADHRADLYATGVMLYQMLTGRLPRGKFDPPSRIVSGIDRRLDRIVDRALQPKPEARYQDARDITDALGPLIRSSGRARPKPAPRIISRKRPALLVFGAFAVIGTLLYFSPWQNRRPVDPGEGLLADSKAEAGTVIGGPAVTKPGPTPGAPKIPSPRQAGRTAPFVNTLGQEFVPVPGTSTLFCKWETRVQDYAAYARAVAAKPQPILVDDSWRRQDKIVENISVPVSIASDSPVCGVNWGDAQAFCAWLTETERTLGRLPEGMRYRLPTDLEWSRAVGLPPEEGATPKERHRKNKEAYPWGTGFPPPSPRVGNYADSVYHTKFPKEKWMEGYTDGFATTAPVGSFPPNEFGLHDLGGNVWEWCEDLFEPGSSQRTGRGASWVNFVGSPLSSSRMNEAGDMRQRDTGFRVVLDLGGIGGK